VAEGGAAQQRLRVCALYPDLMNIYADRGNIAVLERRCAWRGIAFELEAIGLGGPLGERDDRFDLYYLGGGQDRDQQLCAADLVAHKQAGLQSAAQRGAVVLGVCGGYQLLGRSYAIGREEVPGLGLLDLHTVREEGPRLIGHVAISLDGERRAATDADVGDPWAERILAGFENHGGRTYLNSGQQPFGRVLAGHGNDGRSGFEGGRRANVIGTYLHGPLLPKNAWYADELIELALGLDAGSLEPLDDGLERAAHAEARRAAGI
jgi:CobQ-like glutamine amidotransferase family enzyme